ncbi:MAG TPA: hypothetical protein VMA97_08475 [Streptosporangiaceae bacterium]|nr:hypothetical protein [Streptosporangiaceae bacterium]
MTVRPDDGPEFGQELWEKPAPRPEQLEEEQRELFGGERELYEHEETEREVNYLDPEDNELHAPAGHVCSRCGTAISALQEVRLQPDGHWVHEICPIRPS